MLCTTVPSNVHSAGYGSDVFLLANSKRGLIRIARGVWMPLHDEAHDSACPREMCREPLDGDAARRKRLA